MKELWRQFPQLQLSYKTIHGSKGLEADHVILLEANSGQLGFPSEIEDDPLLSLVSPEEEAFQNAEERRVMYVAMTRARSTLTILTSYSKPSAFVTELKNDPAYAIASTPSDEQENHVCTECGGRILRVVGKDSRIWYRCEHILHCQNYMPACQSCCAALPSKVEGTNDFRCVCGVNYQGCPSCQQGWLVERSSQYGRFLSCVRFPTHSCDGKVNLPR